MQILKTLIIFLIMGSAYSAPFFVIKDPKKKIQISDDEWEEIKNLEFHHLPGQSSRRGWRSEKSGFNLVSDNFTKSLSSLYEFDPEEDYDGDGLINLIDPDIDNDGVRNYLDEFPFDESSSGKDEDDDGIPDFLDFEVHGLRKDMVSNYAVTIQKMVFDKAGAVIAFSGESFTDDELRTIKEEYVDNSFSILRKFKKLDVIIKTYGADKLASYNKYWNGMTFFNNEYHDKNIKNFRASFIHETFHVLAAENPEKLNEFNEISGWRVERIKKIKYYFYTNSDGVTNKFTPADFRVNLKKVQSKLNDYRFPSDYAKNGPDEMFAEAGVSTLIIQNNRHKEFNLDRYNNLQKFESTPVFDFMREFISDF